MGWPVSARFSVPTMAESKEIKPDSWGDYTQADGDVETIQNKERGCGYLKAGNAYIRLDPQAFSSEDGVLPGFVVLTDDQGDLHPIPYKESLPRGYETLNGSNFMAAAEVERNFTPLYPGDADAEESHQEAHEAALENMVDHGVYPSVAAAPTSELARHTDRMAIDGFDGEHWGTITAANSKDLMMRAGKSYYDHPWDFIDEVLELGLNKGISVHSNKSPPTIQPGRTRCWIIHPHACGEDMPGVVGFAYLTRTIYTRDLDGNVPSYAEDYAAADKLDVVDIGEPEAREEDEERDGEDVAEAHRGLDEFDPSEPAAEPTVDIEGDAEIEDVTTRGDVIPPQQIEELQKAELSELAGQNWISADDPPAEHDAVDGDGGIIGLVQQGGSIRKVTASNNFTWDSEEGHGSSVVGPYTVEVRKKNGDRMILVEK